MKPIHFYQVSEATPAAIDEILPALLNKAYNGSQPVLILAPTPERAQRLDEGLWGGLKGLGPESFLPHARAGSAHDNEQPILLANLEESPDSAALCQGTPPRLPFVLAGAEAPLQSLLDTTEVPRILYIFSTAPHDIERARSLYKTYKTLGHPLKYYAQDNGRWVEKG